MTGYRRDICRRCKAQCEQRRLVVVDSDGTELPAVQCLECEAVCLVVPVAAASEPEAPTQEVEP
jgi:MinD superfamily P-loop ATPase